MCPVSAPGVFQKLWDLTLNGLQKPIALEYLVDIMNQNFLIYVLLESWDKFWNMLNWYKKKPL